MTMPSLLHTTTTAAAEEMQSGVYWRGSRKGDNESADHADHPQHNQAHAAGP